MERTDMDYLGRLIAALTSVRGINKSDAFMLASRSGSLAEVIKVSRMSEMPWCVLFDRVAAVLTRVRAISNMCDLNAAKQGCVAAACAAPSRYSAGFDKKIYNSD
eukprot:GHRR01026764.1.p1 GENE.GHRR01026764.1~~GHRR01026764.1.p1  ORF type:complete len:105 (+),score=23.57 GHRR01026764.1:761-1075(+)